ncbi:MAG TPA: hypothetical protein VLG25_00135 [Patescibacteria group bacterium]|nr:hypothetical protein [Patescibacteria group bacterium]
MEFKGNKLYLTPEEQRQSGYSSPIDMGSFDLHTEHLRVDGEMDRLSQLAALDPHELSSEERASVPVEFTKAQTRWRIVHGITKELSTRTVEVQVVESVEQLIKDEPRQ